MASRILDGPHNEIVQYKFYNAVVQIFSSYTFSEL